MKSYEKYIARIYLKEESQHEKLYSVFDFYTQCCLLFWDFFFSLCILVVARHISVTCCTHIYSKQWRFSSSLIFFSSFYNFILRTAYSVVLPPAEQKVRNKQPGPDPSA